MERVRVEDLKEKEIAKVEFKEEVGGLATRSQQNQGI
jgi:hypothetical protein